MTTANARFFAAPVPVLLHIVAIIPYSILGTLQFIPALRRGKRRWHRIAGWVLVPSGLVVALSGLWMTIFYPWPAGDGEALYVMRLLAGLAMSYAIIRGVFALRQRRFVQHGAWMLRGYALGMGAGTQVLTHLPWLFIAGAAVTPDELSRAIMMGAGWVINILLAEWIIRTKMVRPPHSKPSVASPGMLVCQRV